MCFSMEKAVKLQIGMGLFQRGFHSGFRAAVLFWVCYPYCHSGLWFFWLKPCKDLKMKDQHAKTSADVNWCSSSQARGAPPAYGVPGQLQTCSGRLFRPNPSHLCSIFTVNSVCKSWGAAQPVLLEKKS